MTKEKKTLMKRLREADLTPSTLKIATSVLKSDVRPRLASLRFLNKHPDRGVPDAHIMVMAELQKKGFGYTDIAVVMHVKQNNGMGVWQVLHKSRYPKLSRVLNRLGARRTGKARAKAATAPVPVAQAQVQAAVVQAPVADSVGVISIA